MAAGTSPCRRRAAGPKRCALPDELPEFRCHGIAVLRPLLDQRITEVRSSVRLRSRFSQGLSLVADDCKRCGRGAVTRHNGAVETRPPLCSRLKPVPLSITPLARVPAQRPYAPFRLCASSRQRALLARWSPVRPGVGSAAAPRLPRPLQCLSRSRAFRLTSGRPWSIDTPSRMHTSMARAEVPARTLPGHLPRLSRGRRGLHALRTLSA
jgi:hypothetical protein